MGSDPLVGEIPRGVSPPGGAANGGHRPQTPTIWDMGLPTYWGGTGNSGTGGDRVYFACCQNTVTQFIVTCPIIDLCLAAERNPGMLLSRKWWDKPALDILGIRAGRAATEGGGGRDTGLE